MEHLNLMMDLTILVTGKWDNAWIWNDDYADGGIYYGNWSNNLRHGEGDMTYSNQTTYIGNWKYDKPNGYGSSRMENETIYDGDWLDGVEHGQGILTNPLGKRFAQIYIHGILTRSTKL